MGLGLLSRKGSECPKHTHGEEAARDVLSWSTSPQGGCLGGRRQSRSHRRDSSHQSGAVEERALAVRRSLCSPAQPGGSLCPPGLSERHPGLEGPSSQPHSNPPPPPYFPRASFIKLLASSINLGTGQGSSDPRGRLREGKGLVPAHQDHSRTRAERDSGSSTLSIELSSLQPAASLMSGSCHALDRKAVKNSCPDSLCTPQSKGPRATFIRWSSTSSTLATRTRAGFLRSTASSFMLTRKLCGGRCRETAAFRPMSSSGGPRPQGQRPSAVPWKSWPAKGAAFHWAG